MATLKELKVQAKARKIPKYSRMNKPQLMSALGMSNQPTRPAKPLGDARARSTAKQHGIAKTYAADKLSGKLGGDDEGKKEAIKKRIVNAVGKKLKAQEKELGRKLTIEEKRSVAVKALSAEVKAIKSGVPQQRRKPAAERKAAQKAEYSSKNKELDKQRQKVRGAAIASGMSEKEANLHAFKTVKPHSLIREKLAKEAEKSASAKPAKEQAKPEAVEQKIKLEDVKTPEDRAKYAKQEAAHQRSLGNEKAAKSWDDEGRKAHQTALNRDIAASKASQTSLFGVTDHASDMPLFGGQASAEAPKKPASAPTGLAEVSPHDLNFDPKRFQYKMVHGAETGASGSLTDVRKWDENLGGVMQIWRDPSDGKDYVVNGHNRATLARKLGAEKVAVRYLNVDTPHEARAIGALTNIAEGRGNALDAAKFFRDSGITREDLEAKGIPMKEAIATNGLALSKLAPHLFDKVVQGDIPLERATLIGDRIHDHDSQAKLVELVDKAQSKGRKITNDVVRELADTVQSAPTHTETQFDLFGASEVTQNLALEKAELTAHVRGRLSREKKLFGLVSKSKAASELERGGNTIDTEKSKDISDQAGQVLGVFDQLKNQSGPVSTAINKAVARIANGENQKQVQDELHRELLEEIPHALGIRKKPSSEGNESAPSGGTGQKRLKVRKAA